MTFINNTYTPKADWTCPAVECIVISPTDNTPFPAGPCRGIYVGTTGNITLQTLNGDTVLFSNVPVGILPVITRGVNATNTTASNMVALY